MTKRYEKNTTVRLNGTEIAFLLELHRNILFRAKYLNMGLEVEEIRELRGIQKKLRAGRRTLESYDAYPEVDFGDSAQ